jgi:hypothetical protein
LLRPSEEEILKRWHSKARSGLGGLTRRYRISRNSARKSRSEDTNYTRLRNASAWQANPHETRIALIATNTADQLV